MGITDVALEHDTGLLGIVRVEEDMGPKGVSRGRQFECVPKLFGQWRLYCFGRLIVWTWVPMLTFSCTCPYEGNLVPSKAKRRVSSLCVALMTNIVRVGGGGELV